MVVSVILSPRYKMHFLLVNKSLKTIKSDTSVSDYLRSVNKLPCSKLSNYHLFLLLIFHEHIDLRFDFLVHFDFHCLPRFINIIYCLIRVNLFVALSL